MSTAYQQFRKGINSSSRRLFTRDRCVFWICITLHLLLSVVPNTLGDVLSCKSQQGLELHRPGIINCSVSEHIRSFLWYLEDGYPTIIVASQEDQQIGTRIGDLTIAQNGSLIFSNVSMSDEGRYRFDAVLDAGGDVSTYIDVTVVVLTTQMFPTIDDCQGDDCPSSSCIFDLCNSSVTIRVKVTSYFGQIEFPQCLMCLVTLPGSGFSDVSSVTLQLNGKKILLSDNN
ncbi:uncharacterized protein [Apostichopus japonicus]|uniref:uncharacterized protein n=1 Tax=Stichopus japonicus TaxID=307972 RepID=UPI003AB5C1B8